MQANTCMWQLMLSCSGKTPISGESPKRRKAAGPSESDVNVDVSDFEEKDEDFKDCEKGT